MATKLPESERFFHPEISKVFWLPTIAAANRVPTRAEITAGHDLTDEIAAVAGWQKTTAMIATPDWGSRFTSSIPGRTSAADSSITFYADLDGDDVRAVLSAGLSGYVVFADGGDNEGSVTDKLGDVFPVRVASVGKVRGQDAAMQLTVSFAITREPADDITLPAAA